MTGLVGYIRDLLRWTDLPKPSYKRSRLDDDSEDDQTSINITTLRLPKRQKIETEPLNEYTETTVRRSPRVRYIPIQVEQHGPGTSTPQNTKKPQYMILRSSQKKALMNNEEVSIDEDKVTGNSVSKYFIEISSEEDEDDDDVVFIQKQKSKESFTPSYSKFDHSLRRRNTSRRPRIFNGSGVTKSYKSEPPPSFPVWLNEVLNRKTQRPANSTGDSYNLEEKKLYQELLSNQKDSFLARAMKAQIKTDVTKDSKSTEAETASETHSSTRVVDPVNSLKESFKDISITKNTWLADLDKKYEAKKRDILGKNLETTQETSKVLEKLRKENSSLLMQYDLKLSLQLPSALIETKRRLHAELPPLTKEQNQIIDLASADEPQTETLIEKFSLKILRSDIKTLQGLNWLNDVIINFYMNLITQRSRENPHLPKTYTTNTFFFQKLQNGGQAGVKRWTKKVDIFGQDLMVIPVHLRFHWCMCLVDMRRKRVEYMDSMNGEEPGCLELVLTYLIDEHIDKKGRPLDVDEWETKYLQNVPQQMNGSDCGMFAITFAEFASRGAPFNFSQKDMPYLRRKAIWEITQGRLLL